MQCLCFTLLACQIGSTVSNIPLLPTPFEPSLPAEIREVFNVQSTICPLLVPRTNVSSNVPPICMGSFPENSQNSHIPDWQLHQSK